MATCRSLEDACMQATVHGRARKRGGCSKRQWRQFAPQSTPWGARGRCESTTLTTFIVNNTLRAKQHIARFEEVILTTEGTDGHGNAEIKPPTRCAREI